MVASCCVPKCKQRHQSGGAISFHTFPKDEFMRAEWLRAIKRETFVPSRFTKVCSRHFKPTDFRYNFGQKTLKPDSVPSIFDLTARERPTMEPEISVLPPEQPVPIINEVHVNSDDCVEEYVLLVDEPTEAPVRRRRSAPYYFGDYTEADLGDPVKVRNMWLTARSTIEKHRKTIKCLQAKNYKLLKKVASLKSKIQEPKVDKVEKVAAISFMKFLGYNLSICVEFKKHENMSNMTADSRGKRFERSQNRRTLKVENNAPSSTRHFTNVDTLCENIETKVDTSYQKDKLKTQEFSCQVDMESFGNADSFLK